MARSPRLPASFSRDSIALSLFSFSSFAIATIALLAFLTSNVAQAQIDWNNTNEPGMPAPWYDLGFNWQGGSIPGTTDSARFNQAAAYEVWWDATSVSAAPGVGFMQLLSGDVTFLNQDLSSQLQVAVNGSGGSGSFSDFAISGGGTTLTNRGMQLHSFGGGQITGGATLTLDGSHAQGARLSVDGSTGFDVSGNLNVQSGAVFGNTTGSIGRTSGSTGAATVTGVGSRWNNSGNLQVGYSGNGTLMVDAGGKVSSDYGLIGEIGGSTGAVTVTGVGSQWNNAQSLFLGGTLTDGGVGTLNLNAGGQVQLGNDLYTGGGTALTVSDFFFNGNLFVRHGSIITNAGVGYVGYNIGAWGEATVTGSGSEWNNSSTLYVGYSGVGHLDVEAEGRVSNTTGFIGYNSDSVGTATVTGVDSQWNSSSNLFVGYDGSGRLNVEAGGRVSNTTGYLGALAGGTGVATVTGSGSQWINSSELYVGHTGDGTLNVQAGGVVSNVGGTIGFNSDSVGVATVTGSGSQWNHSSDLVVGHTGQGTLNVQSGGAVSNVGGIIGFDSGSSGAATVTDSGSQWNHSSTLIVGYNGAGELNVAAGGRVSNTTGFVGGVSGSSGAATVTGSGSQWTNSGGLFVGGTDTTDGGAGTLNLDNGGHVNVGDDLESGGGTALTVSDSGTDGILFVRHGSTITNSGSGAIGLTSGRTGVATVTGSGSRWNNSGDVYVGHAGDGTLNVETEGRVNAASGYIGYNSLATGLATVTGTGSQWNNLSTLSVGESGDGTLNVEAGGRVGNTFGYIGRNAGSTGAATVTGTGSQWIGSDDLYVGYDGDGTLNVLAGGKVGNRIGFLGYNSGSLGTATVNGVDSQWINEADLVVGVYGHGTLDVQDGGRVNHTTSLFGSYIGSFAGSTGVATVTGSGSEWNNQTALFVGYDGDGTLNVQAGGLVSNVGGGLGPGIACIGCNPGSTGAATVTGSGSRWNNSGGLFLGGSTQVDGGVGTLNVDNGGRMQVGNDLYTGLNALTVSDSDANGKLFVRHGSTLTNAGFGYIGYNAGMTGVATVTGSESEWNNSGHLFVGHDGNGTLNVQAGGLVSNAVGFVGLSSGSTGVATVTGSGSRWNSSGGLYLGGEVFDGGVGMLNVTSGGLVNVGNDWYTGSGPVLTVSDSGANGNLVVRHGSTIAAGGGIIGYFTGSTGVATVTGSGSEWKSVGYLYVGFVDGDGTLNIQDGGLVSDLVGEIGYGAGSTGFVTVTGSGSRWNNLFELSVGCSGGGTLNIEAGGLVSDVSGHIGRDPGSIGLATVSGSGSQWNNTEELRVGTSGNGTLNVQAGGQVGNTHGHLGFKPGSIGLATVSGSGSQWTNSGELRVGNSGNGTLNVQAEGRVSNTHGLLGFEPGAMGLATVTGNGSEWNSSANLQVGLSGSGTLNVQAGGQVKSNTDGNPFGSSTIGANSGSMGTATVTGDGSQWMSSNMLNVGLQGNGTLNVEAGGLVSNRVGYIGRFSTATGAGTVTGSGSKWNNSAGLYLGGSDTTDGGVGTLNVENLGQANVGDDPFVGADNALTISDTGSNGKMFVRHGSTVTNTGFGILGFSSGKTGVVTVTGSGSQWNSFQLFVGLSGNGTLNVQDGGMVSSAVGFVGRQSGSTSVATVTGSGSQWDNSQSLSIGGGQTDAGGTGTLNIANGGLVSVGGTTKIWSSGSVSLNTGGTLNTQTLDLTLGSFEMLGGGVLHAEIVLGGLTNLSGVLAPGQSAGTTTINGDYVQGSAATLQIEIGGATPGSFDQVVINGVAYLAGTLDIATIDGFSPSLPGQLFTIATIGDREISSEFHTVVGVPSTALPGLFWTTTYTPTSVILTTSAIAGDIDLDGDVDRRDAALFSLHFGKQAGSLWNTGDFDGDGATTFADLALLQTHMGQSLAPSSSAAAVPEPSTCMLMACGLVTMIVAFARSPLRRSTARG